MTSGAGQCRVLCASWFKRKREHRHGAQEASVLGCSSFHRSHGQHSGLLRPIDKALRFDCGLDISA